MVLLPVASIGSLLLAVLAIAQNQPFSQTASMVVLFVCLLQLGYVGSALFKHVVLSADSADWSSLGSPEASIEPASTPVTGAGKPAFDQLS